MATSSKFDYYGCKIAKTDRFAMNHLSRHIGALFLALALFSLPSWAQENDASLYQVSDVAVDVTSDSAAHARDQAILKAQQAALEQLLSRLGVEDGLASRLDAGTIGALVQAFEVQQERTSAVRYIGIFTVQFKPNAVRNLLGKHGTSYNEARSKPFVVLPVVSTGGRNILWENRNPWRTAWESVTSGSGLVPVIVPPGEMDDISVISGTEAVSGKTEALQAIAHKYQAGGTVVALLTGDLDRPTQQPIRIDVLRTDAAGKAAEPVHFTLPGAPDSKALMALLADGIKQVRGGLEGGWKQTSSFAKGPVAHMQADVPVTSLAQWAEIKTRLSTVPAIKRTNVVTLTRGNAHINLEYLGDLPQLQGALAQQNLSLEQDPGTGGWQLRSAPSAP
ncbi:MAG: DUF2066 domain-containing protein [Alphaproteobacteria bacterium]|nr:DUF2066 domain-containing protein [Alphaproteobacteria bacterium]